MIVFSTGEVDLGGVDEPDPDREIRAVISSLLLALVIVTLSLNGRCCREPRVGGGGGRGDRVREVRSDGEGEADGEIIGDEGTERRADDG